VQALIFDLDGVITDTSAEFHYLSWQQLADEEGLPFSREANHRLRGVNRMESLKRFLNGLTITAEQQTDWMHRKNAYYQDLLPKMSPADRLPGITEILNEAREAGLKLGVASASRNARDVLERLELLSYFDVIGDAQSAVNPKPAPDLFIWVAGYLRAHIRETIIFEDSKSGVEAALNAGFWTVGIGGDEVRKAHICYQTLRNITLSEILQHLK
jgi:beta-phosphoglucomutase